MLAFQQGEINSVNIPTAAGEQYHVTRAVARVVARKLFENPADAIVTARSGVTSPAVEENGEGMTAVAAWSADARSDSLAAGRYSRSLSGFDSQNNDTVAVMIPLHNSMYRGLRASDIKAVKAKGVAAGDSHKEFTRVDSASSLAPGRFVVVERDATARRDRVLTANEIIRATDRRDGGAPEMNSLQYFALIAIKKGSDFDGALPSAPAPNENFVVADPAVIVAVNPFLKVPALSSALHGDIEQVYGWRRDDRTNAAVQYWPAGGGVWPLNNGNATYDYPTTAVAAMMRWNRMHFVSDEVVTRYGFDPAAVYKLPAATAGVNQAGKVALVMHTIRDMTLFAGKTPSEIRVIDVRSDVKPDTLFEYNRADSAALIEEGSFAILKPNAFDRHLQDVVGPNETLVEGGLYFLALAARDGRNWDIDANNPTTNNRVNFSPAFVVVEGTVVTPTLNLTPSSARIEEIGGTVELVASVSDGSDVPAVTWESSDEAVATVADGVVTAVADGQATISCVPPAGSELNTATAVITVGRDVPPPSGGSSGGCSVGGFAPATLFLLAPLFLLLKK